MESGIAAAVYWKSKCTLDNMKHYAIQFIEKLPSDGVQQ